MKKEKVLVIGGHGFIGSHIVKTINESNLEAHIGSRSTPSSPNSVIPEIAFNLKNISDTELIQILSDYQYVIFAGGADDRTIPKGKAFPFFYNGNVIPCKRLAQACQFTNVQKIIIIGSYFTHFNRLRPEWKMQQRHAYVKSRVLQQIETKEAAAGKTKIVTLEIPYVFGSAPNKTPLWKPLINYINRMPLVFYTKGGTNIIAVEQVAKATLGAIKYTGNEDHFILGGQNISWKNLIELIGTILGKNKIILILPNSLIRIIGWITKYVFKSMNRSPGLDPYHFVEIQTANTFIDGTESINKLRYEETDLKETIRNTIIACGFEDYT